MYCEFPLGIFVTEFEKKKKKKVEDGQSQK